MITKFTLVNRNTLIFAITLFFFSIAIILFKSFFAGLALIILYSCIYIFFNSVYTTNIEKSLLMKTNLKGKPLSKHIFLVNGFLYFPIIIIFVMTVFIKISSLPIMLVIIIYQFADIIFLKRKSKIYIYFGTSFVFFLISMILFVLQLN